jgi:4'-phosphopantetheinyl transferase EntD
VIDLILPSSAHVAESFDDTLDPPLFPVEAGAVAAAVPRRQREFATGRVCARRAIASMGRRPVAIGRGEQGEPLWPRGVIGSITHCDGYRGAAVAPADALLTIGIDAEPRQSLAPGLLGSIAVRSEIEQIRELTSGDPDTPWDRLLFSAKESLYKAWFPLRRRTCGFRQVVISLRPQSESFFGWATDGGAGPAIGLRGRWLLTEQHILTAVAPRSG